MNWTVFFFILIYNELDCTLYSNILWTGRYYSLFKYIMDWTVLLSIKVYYGLDDILLYANILWTGLYYSLFKYIRNWIGILHFST